MKTLPIRRAAPAVTLCLLIVSVGCGDDMPISGEDDVAALDVVEDAGTLSDAGDDADTGGADGATTCEKDEDCATLASACVKASCGADGLCVVANTAKDQACSDDDACTPDDKCDGDGACLPGAVTSCDDGNPCTADSCDKEKGCQHVAAGTTCTDGDACTEGDSCSDGVCQSGTTKVCDDGNPCTDDLCDATAGCTTSDNAASCDDGDKCTDGDLCAGGSCTAGATVDCDDKQVCTEDSCDAKKGCVHAAAAGACDDGDACTLGDSCGDGACLPGAVTACDDANPCTDDGCDKIAGCANLANAVTCSDDDACTTDDTCKDATCVPGAAPDCDDKNPCTADSCDATKGCVATPTAKGSPCTDGNACTGAKNTDGCDGSGVCASGPVDDCDDKNACTTDSCDPVKGCQHSNNDKPCTDGSVCTTGDVCADGKCAGGKAFDCDDGNPCTDDSCDATKGCQHSDNTKPCDDNNSCTKDEQCAAGACKAVTPSKCDDGNVCTTESCDPVKGCQSANNTAPCADGDVCTQADECKGGSCIAGKKQACSDGNVCTTDSCDASSGCVNTANEAKCSDDNACTSDDACVKGGCVATLTFSCDDGQVCTADSCDPTKGCQHKDIDVPCSDGDDCTAGDKCAAGKCAAGKKLDCDDGNVCTDDTCKNNEDGTGGCASAPAKLPGALTCTDGNACTSKDACKDGTCQAGGVTDCDDNNVCTADSCTPAKGCAHTNVGALCSDGDVCTLSDVCKDGTCASTGKLSCTDGNPCTDDSCDKKTGCKFTANSHKCDDGNACTSGDLCKGGKCNPGIGKACDDGNPCTTDSCSVATGCTYKANSGTCSDGNACTESDTCASKKCQAGSKKVCNDGNPCTDDSCDAKKGCVALNNTIGCNDNDSCTAGDKCANGKCAGKPTVNCDDSNVCTTDKCDGNKGCTNVANTSKCSDGNACTAGDVCKSAACQAGAAVKCDDKNVCTIDSCDKAKGCLTSNVKDGLLCGGVGACATGSCLCPKEMWLNAKGTCASCGCDPMGTKPDAGAKPSIGALVQTKDGVNGDEFGRAIARSGDWMLVSARYDDDKTTNSGSVYSYQRQASGAWKQMAKLQASDPGSGDAFGQAVAVDGDWAVVGAPFNDDKGTNSGSIYVFKLSNGAWKQAAKLLASDGAASDNFGFAVGISGGRIIASAIFDDDTASNAGSAYVFELQKAGAWKQTAKLGRAVRTTNEYFGGSVAIDGDLLVVGSPSGYHDGVRTGAADVFERTATGAWIVRKTLRPSTVAPNDAFGVSVAIHGRRIAVGARYGDGKVKDSGAVFVFAQQSDGLFKQALKAWALDGTSGDAFGFHVALNGDRLLVGAPYDDPKGSSSGAAYLFAISGTGKWGQTSKVAPAGSSSGSRAGWSVVLDARGGAIGGPWVSGRGGFWGISTDSFGCSKTGMCACKPGFSGAKCDQVTAPCSVPGLCDDGSACTKDACDKVKGCINTPLTDGATCSDGDACTAPKDTCGGGLCLPGKVTDCDDKNVCTVDTCDIDKGCGYTDAAAGTTCGTTGKCASGGCVCPSESWFAAKGCTACGCDATGSVATAAGLKIKGTIAEKGGSQYDYFGQRIASSGGWLAVGVANDDDKGSNSGSVSLYQQAASGSWVFKTKVYGSNTAANDAFGSAVAMDGKTLVVGAQYEDDKGSNSGAVYVFELQANGTWKQMGKLYGSNISSSQYFGRAVAVSGTRLSATAYNGGSVYHSAAVYVFARQANGTWKQEVKLNTLKNAGSSHEHNGNWLSMSKGRVVLDVPFNDAKASNSGSVNIFERQTNGTWKAAQLKASDAATSDYFGRGFSIDGDWLAVGAPNDDAKGTDSGSVYIFQRQSNGTWKQMTKIVAADGASADYFGFAVSLRAGSLLVGAYGDDDKGSSSGSVYRYAQNKTGAWKATGKVPGTGSNAVAGWSVTQGDSGALFAGVYGANSAKGLVYVLGAGSFGCSGAGQCTCKPGYGGDKCDKVNNVCLIPGGCDDGNACTIDSCDKSAKKCLYSSAKNGTVCGAGMVCSVGKCMVQSTTGLTKITIAGLEQAHTGNLGGIAGANLLCAKQAAAAGDKRQWKAFLSTSKQDVKDLISGTDAVNLVVYNSKNEKTYDNWNDIFDGKSQADTKHYTFKGVYIDESSKVTPPWNDADGWTGSLADGTYSKDLSCKDWTSTSGNGRCTELDLGYDLVKQETRACSLTLAVMCVTVSAYSLGDEGNPAASCLDLVTKRPDLKGKNGDYWITTPSKKKLKVYCDMTSEGGGYTYYPIASGTKTYKVTAGNSCKDLGLRMVMLRSKVQWKALLAKYGASYFAVVPGVYKPTNYGNYTYCAMRNPKSYGSGCKDWRVADGGRWWMRDTKTSEPNGDYHANCWLGMGNTNPDGMTFNDGNCNYHTSKYVCSTNDKK